MRDQHTLFVYSYQEHEPPPPELSEGEAGNQEFVRRLHAFEWEQRGPAENDLSADFDPGVESVADLMGRVRKYFALEPTITDEAVRIPFDKLAALMRHGGWSFVGGAFDEFEGHHNDTEITVVLKRQASAS